MKEFITLTSDEGTKIVSRTSVALMEDIGNGNYKITMKETREDGKSISFVIIADYSLLLQLFGGF